VDRLAAVGDERLLEALKMIAPGTLLRQAIDNIVRARTGALLVFADEEQIKPLISGGIQIDVALRPMILYELAKMDGAILLDRSGSHITHANVQLMPDSSIDSQETGTRHRTAERVAKQLGTLAISISASRDVVTVYLGDIRYIMDPIRTMLDKADQALQTLERFRRPSQPGGCHSHRARVPGEGDVAGRDYISATRGDGDVAVPVDRTLRRRTGERRPAGGTPEGRAGLRGEGG